MQKRQLILAWGVAFGLVAKTAAQNGTILFTTNQVKSPGPAVIGALNIPANYLAWIQGDFVMSGSANFAASTKTIAVQNSNGVLYASAETISAHSSSPGATSWTMGYVLSSSTNVLCQAAGVASETWNGQWLGTVQLVPITTKQGGGLTLPPVISAIAVSSLTSTSAAISWTTDQPANSTVEWGTTTAYGSTMITPSFVTSHSLGISALKPSTVYHYRVKSANSTGQGTVSADNTFMTLADAGVGGCSLTNGIAGYWPFNGDYKDYSGLGNNLTPYNSPGFSSGYIYQALDDTLGGSAYAADNPTLGMGGDVSFTVSCWIRPVNVGAVVCVLAKGDFQSGINDTFVIYNTGSAFRFGLGNGSSFATVDSPVSLSPYNWYHLVGVYDATAHQINLWVNGVGNTPVAWTKGTYHNPGPLSIGAAPDHSYVFSGLIDEVVVWTNRALTGTEIGQIYINSTRGLTPLTYCSGVNARTTVIFNGDARFSVTGANTNMPDYFKLLSWASNHNATIVNYSGGMPPPTPPYVEQVEDLTNSAMTSTVLSYVGPGTNVFWVTEIGINNIYIMQNAPLYGYWTANTIAYQLTNYFRLLSAAGVKVIPLTIYPMIGLDTSPGDGTLATGELVRNYVNAAINNYTGVFATLDVDPWLKTNNVPMWWGPSESELNDLGNTNVAMHLNALLNSKWP